jgi:DNA-binding MurR/RpiR family transcriptional regulator
MSLEPDSPDTDPANGGASLERRVHGAYEQLPPSERKLADLILQFPGDLAAYSATELADLAGVSKAAATRLFRRLGFASFEEARRLARDARDRGSPVYLASAGRSRSDLEQEVADFVREEAAAIAETLERLDRAAVERIARRLAEARRVMLVGFRNSHYLAGYMRGLLGQVRTDVQLVPAAGEAPGDRLAGLDRRDAVVVVAMRRRTRQVSRLMQALHEAGVPLVLITDPTARGLPALADESVVCETETSYLFDSYGPAMAAIRLIAVEVARRLGADGRRQLKAVEALHESLEDLES